MAQKKAMSKAYLGQQEMSFTGEHMISKMGGIPSPEVLSSVWLILGRSSPKKSIMTLRLPGWESSLEPPPFDYQLLLDPEGFFEGL